MVLMAVYGVDGRMVLRAAGFLWAGPAALPRGCFEASGENIVSMTIGVPGGGTFRLRYINFFFGLPNGFKSMIKPYTGTTFDTKIFEDIFQSQPSGTIQHNFEFQLPAGTTGIRLSFFLEVNPLLQASEYPFAVR